MIVNARGTEEQKAFAIRCRCWLDDTEVTSRAFFCDTEQGIVQMFSLNADGRKYVDPLTGDAAVEERSGVVRIAVEPEAPANSKIRKGVG